jgi:hypothetical protein
VGEKKKKRVLDASTFMDLEGARVAKRKTAAQQRRAIESSDSFTIIDLDRASASPTTLRSRSPVRASRPLCAACFSPNPTGASHPRSRFSKRSRRSCPRTAARRVVSVRRVLASVALLLLIGSLYTKPAKPVSPPSAPPASVREACARCHAFPPAATLPRDRWVTVVPEMRTMPIPAGAAPLTEEEAAEALAYYRAAAPDALPPVPPGPPLTTDRFVATHFTPRGLENRKIPAVANVGFFPLTGGLTLVAAELRTRTLFALTRAQPGRPAVLRPLLPRETMDLNYPDHVSAADLNGDGRQDLLVASLGGLNPGNFKRGSVSVLLAAARGFTVHPIAKGLGRVADVRAADLDGDGDLDLAVSVFGWRGPGELLVFEQTGQLTFTRHRLDDRDGWIHLEPLDLDGDGKLDLIGLLTQHHEQVVAFQNKGGLTFAPRVLHRAPHPAWGYSGLERVDLDQDGDADLLLTNGDSLDDHLLKPYHGISWLENDGVGGFAPHRIADGLPGCQRATAGDLDGDGDLDVVAVSFLPQIPAATWEERDLSSIVWIERDTKGWQIRSLEKHRNIHSTVALGDVDGNGKLDIVVGNFVWLYEEYKTHTPADYVTLLMQE